MKKLFLTSMLVFGVIPAFAEPTPESTFPNAANDEYMQENRRYINAATHDNILVYGVPEVDDTVYANAQYEWVMHTIKPGEYLEHGEEAVGTCVSGSFCPGLSEQVHYDELHDQGITSCSTIGDGSWGSSDPGARAETDCYKPCTTANIPNSLSVSGNDYYGSGTDSCDATACAPGYSQQSSTPNLMELIGDVQGDAYAYVATDGSDDYNASNYGLNPATDLGKFLVDYGNKGIVTGQSRCSTRSGNIGDTTATLPDNNGQYCYCKIDGYIPSGESFQGLSSPWQLRNGPFGGTCEEICPRECSMYLSYNVSQALVVREALFGAVQQLRSCQANTITINWNGADPTEIAANNAGTCLYNGDINTPRSATPVPGKTFLGWQFSLEAPQD